MLLRYFAIAILVFIALRLLGRLFAALSGPREAPEERVSHSPRPAVKPPQRKLEPCAHCGTYFDPTRALTSGQTGSARFCSDACLDAHSLEVGGA